MARDTPYYRDDLISSCYVLREMTQKGLPWNDCRGVSAFNDMLSMKRDMNGTSLFGDNSLWNSSAENESIPDCAPLAQLFDNIKQLNWNDEPDFKLGVGQKFC